LSVERALATTLGIGGVGSLWLLVFLNGRCKAAVRPHGLPGLEVHDGEESPRLRVTNVRARLDVLGVAGPGDIARNNRGLGALGILRNHDEDVDVVRRQHQVGSALSSL
jgi:hypothetical protein